MKNIIALAVLVVLGVVAFFIFTGGEEEVAQKEEVSKVLKPVPSEEVSRIEIIRHEGTEENQVEEKIVLAKKGEDWRMVEPVDYAVNTTAVGHMVDALAELKPIDVISENKERHGALLVDDETGIKVTAKSGEKVLADIIVGVSRNAMTMVRLPGEEKVYRTHGSFRVTFNKKAENLRDKAVFQLDRGSVARMKVANEKGELELVKVEPTEENPEATFAPVGVEIENFDAKKAERTAAGLTGISARGFIDDPAEIAAAGLGEGAAKVEFDATDDEKAGTFTLWIGKANEENRTTAVKTSLSEQVFTVATSLAERFLVGADDFARTDEEMAKQEEARKKAEERRMMQAQGGGMPGGMPAGPGGQQIPPEVMQQIQAQMKKQGITAQ